MLEKLIMNIWFPNDIIKQKYQKDIVDFLL